MPEVENLFDPKTLAKFANLELVARQVVEGFISGLLSAHTGKEFSVKEVDCWCSGDRVCRFEVRPIS